MKKIGIIILVFTFNLISCNEDNSDEQANCEGTFDLLIGKDWFPPEESADIRVVVRFDSNGDYFENEVFGGTWELEDNCTIIHFFAADFSGLDFQYEIISISSGTLKIKDSSGTIITYHTLSFLIG